jgi:2-polyprenyl-3-methyl-5-hydroxy-6-metoxy-1,4-benzoquinol methylase
MLYNNKRDLVESILRPTDVVLDVGFWGQGVDPTNEKWLHNIIKSKAKEVYGLDLEVSEEFLKDSVHYKKVAAEHADFPVNFDVIFAGDLIEHLVNPGLFLDACKKMLKEGGMLVLTTPNTFNLFNLVEKITKYDPTVNPDHTFYFNQKTLKVLLQKCGFEVNKFHYVYKLDTKFVPSFKKKILDFVYAFLAKFTDKFIETIVVVAYPKE